MKILKTDNLLKIISQRATFGSFRCGHGCNSIAWGATDSGRIIFCEHYGLADELENRSAFITGGVKPKPGAEELAEAIASADATDCPAWIIGADESERFAEQIGGLRDATEQDATTIFQAVDGYQNHAGDRIFKVIFEVSPGWVWESFKMAVNPLPPIRKFGGYGFQACLMDEDCQFPRQFVEIVDGDWYEKNRFRFNIYNPETGSQRWVDSLPQNHLDYPEN